MISMVRHRWLHPASDHPCYNHDYGNRKQYYRKPVRQFMNKVVESDRSSGKNNTYDIQNIHLLPPFPSNLILNARIFAEYLLVKITPMIIIPNAIPSPKLPIAS